MFNFRKKFEPVQVFDKDGVRMTIFKIAGKPVEGRRVYGHFLTDHEYDILFPVSGNIRVVPLVDYKKSHFRKDRDMFMRVLLSKEDIPIRKIGNRHILGWSFKK
ncbi:MAG: hypothetical protein KAI57_02070 [Candidatus Pacebacteria bacterium]|nr:hypothetical protein [Candidatus Paceibacterota bacterium]